MKPTLLLVLLLGLCAGAEGGCNRKLFRNRIIYGGRTIRSLHYQTEKSCQDACTKESRCAIFNFFRADSSSSNLRNTCWLKPHPGYDYSDPYPGVTSGYSLKDCPPLAPAPPTPEQCKELLVDVSLTGPYYQSTQNVASAEACQQQCSQDSTCRFFNYLRQDWNGDFRKKYCFLKSGRPTGKSNLPGSTSGYSLTKCP